MPKTKDELVNIITAISALLNYHIKGIPTEEELFGHIDGIIKRNQFDLSEEEIRQVKRNLSQKYQFRIKIGTMVKGEESRTWFSDAKDSFENYYFDKGYKQFLLTEKKYSQQSVDILDIEILDQIMNYLGNPKSTIDAQKKGLVIGDVQSGKTSTYIGLICKAADAGYKVIVVLSGITEALRAQTQERIDEGFVGFNSSFLTKNDEIENNKIGVGKTRGIVKRPITLTTKDTDFVSSTARSIGFSLENVKEPIIFVLKKNVTVLSRLLDWLISQNADQNGKIDFPLLIIDDEADNASPNTNKEDLDPTRINEKIREIKGLFYKSSYVGFTATPFANIFIDPFVNVDGLGDDLFPKDFIYYLNPADQYIGPSQIFYKDSKFNYWLISNDDCETVLPAKHRKDANLSRIPYSLRKALILFFITNAIRDLRGDEAEHRAMLINMSVYTSMHGKIADFVENESENIRREYALYSLTDEALLNEVIIETKLLFEQEYMSTEYDFVDILKVLYKSNESVFVKMINSDNDMVNYKEHKNESARVIFIGGYSLSRGLTLEGLSVSYFYRKSKNYDTLLQMGRWFGYRENYSDICRIFLPSEISDWFERIAETIDELRTDIKVLQESGKTPSDVGIRIKTDPLGLKITAPNKMRTAQNEVVPITIFGEVIDNASLYNDLEINYFNYKKLEDEIVNLKQLVISEKSTYGKYNIFRKVPLSMVKRIIDSQQISPRNYMFDKASLNAFFSKYENHFFNEWDIVIIEGSRNPDSKKISYAGFEISPVQRSFDLYDNNIRIYKSKEMVYNPADTKVGLTEDEQIYCINRLKEQVLKLSTNRNLEKINPSAKCFLRSRTRNPILMIYIIDLVKADDDTKSISDAFTNKPVYPIALALGIPKYFDFSTEIDTYKINKIEQMNKIYKELVTDTVEDLE
jgi:hypothetical protein